MADQDNAQPFVEPSHRLPDTDWAAVLKRAKEIREASDESETE